MNKVNIFFYCSCAILLFTIINLSVGPVISGKAPFEGTDNCAELSDNYDNKKKDPSCDDDCLKYNYEWYLNRCNNEKGMYNMEYTSFIFDVVIGFVCGLMGLLHFYGLIQNFSPKMGLIGLGCGILGFVLTFVYVILNGIVYTTYYNEYTYMIYKRDSDGAFAEKKGDYFECLYFDTSRNTHAMYAKFSDLNKKQYNYNKDITESYREGEAKNCQEDPLECISNNGKIPVGPSKNNCPKLYVSGTPTDEIGNKDLSDRFLTTLLLSLFVCLANIGLALFGFLLYKTPEDSQTKTETNMVNVKNPTSKFSVNENLKE